MNATRRTPNLWPLFLVLLAGCFLALSGWSVSKAALEVSPPLMKGQPAHSFAAAKGEPT